MIIPYLVLLCLVPLPFPVWGDSSREGKGRELIPLPAPPPEDAPLVWGVWRGERSLYLGIGSTIWRYGFITRRWSHLYSSTERVVALLGSIREEGVWTLTQNHAVYHHPGLRKPSVHLLPRALGGDRRGEEVVLLGEGQILWGKGQDVKRIHFPQGLSAAVLYRDGLLLLEPSGRVSGHRIPPQWINEVPLGPWQDLKRCGEELYGLAEEGWRSLSHKGVTSPGDGRELLCAEESGAVLLTEAGFWYVRGGRFLGFPPHGTLGRGALVAVGNRFLYAFLLPQGIETGELPLTEPPTFASPLLMRHCLKPLPELLLRIFGSPSPPEERLEEWLSRSRVAGWVPRVRVQGDLDRTSGFTLAEGIPYSTSTERGVILIGPTLTTLDRNARLGYAARLELTWELDRLVFSDDETRIVTAWERVIRERERALLFARSLWESLSDPNLSWAQLEGTRSLFLSLWGEDPLEKTPACLTPLDIKKE